jgi:hypothetical protein
VATTLLVLATVWALFGGWLAGVPFVAALPAALASLVGWLTSAWRREAPGRGGCGRSGSPRRSPPRSTR